MSDTQTPTTELTSQYTAQVAGDLEHNTKDQERITAEIDALQEQLHALQHDHTVLTNMQKALGGADTAGAEPAAAPATATPSVPRQASAEAKQGKEKKAAAGSAKKTTSKKTAAKASSTTDAKAVAKPTLVELIRGHLQQQSEPRSAAEISATLGQAHPDRNIKTTVVRTTLEGLVAKSHAHRTKQGSSVFYTASAGSQPAQDKQQAEEVSS
ncbi:hypothetical protein [Streptomyces sp. NPDC050704]|uniref:hypothetical protein n=1 Tax=Streptomyces sp. NPDC050704 TaxID=3157219 RepID=UPI003420E811